VLATKYTLSADRDDPNAGGSHRKNLRRAIDASLERLGTDYIDVYWVHIWDAFTPVEEVIRALDDLVRSGKVLYVGISDTPAWMVSRAVTLAEERGLTPFCALQVPYSLVERTVERELLPMARATSIQQSLRGSTNPAASRSASRATSVARPLPMATRSISSTITAGRSTRSSEASRRDSSRRERAARRWRHPLPPARRRIRTP
jgi:aryl-alcohol dehydrogenase-like predicted oxidoreductase